MNLSADINAAGVGRSLAGRDDRMTVLALLPPLAVRLYGDGTEAAIQRALMLLLAMAIAYAWAALFSRPLARSVGWNLSAFAMIFVVLLPGPVAWGAAALALSFGCVFGREIFGGRAILPPALVALAFAIFSFPVGGFEARGILVQSPDLLFAASCLPGAVVLMLRGALVWQIAAGAVAGLAAIALLMGVPEWWWQPGLGVFVATVLFLAAAPESAAGGPGARWLHGLLVGGLTALIRVADPNQPDAVVFAVLLGALFAPLLGRALHGRIGHE